MITKVNFGTSREIYKGFNQNLNNGMIAEQRQDGFIRKTANAVANVQKGYIGIKDGIVGITSAIVSGLVSGAAVLGLNWTIGRMTGRGVKGQSILTTPIKTAAGMLTGVAKKIGSIPSKNIGQILSYPFIGFPKDIFNYVKNAQGCTKLGKTLAVGVGATVAGLMAIGALIGINKSFADVDHGFRVGHNR